MLTRKHILPALPTLLVLRMTVQTDFENDDTDCSVPVCRAILSLLRSVAGALDCHLENCCGRLTYPQAIL